MEKHGLQQKEPKTKSVDAEIWSFSEIFLGKKFEQVIDWLKVQVF